MDGFPLVLEEILHLGETLGEKDIWVSVGRRNGQLHDV